MFNIIAKTKLWFTLSAILTVIGLYSIFAFGLRMGLDFTGGSLLEMHFTERPAVQELQTTLTDLEAAQIQPAGTDKYIIRSKTLTETQHQDVLKKITEKYPTAIEDRFESIGPTIGAELRTKSIWSIVIVLIAIVAYIAFAFRKVSRPIASWKYGIAAIIALAHDLLMAVGIYALVSHYTGWEVDSLFITALLTLLGFSVHDTIVTFDRTRELLRSHTNESFPELVNRATNETLVRSLNTSLTAILVLFAIFLFGGASIRHFVFTLLIGMVVGTYSSIFIASPILVAWERWSKKGSNGLKD